MTDIQPRHRDGKYAEFVHADAADDAITTAAALAADHRDALGRGEEVEVTGAAAAAVVPGASRVALQYADPDFYAEADFAGFDLNARIEDMLSNGENHAYTAEEFIDERDTDIDRWFRDRNIIRSGKWDDSTLTFIVELEDRVPSYASAQKAFAADTDTDELRAASIGERDDILRELEEHLAMESCSRCFGDLSDNEGYDGLCGTCADQDENDEDED